MASSGGGGGEGGGGGPIQFHNIQEMVDIELTFELICMLFLSSLQMIRKEETNNKTAESTKLLLYYIVVKRL